MSNNFFMKIYEILDEKMFHILLVQAIQRYLVTKCLDLKKTHLLFMNLLKFWTSVVRLYTSKVGMANFNENLYQEPSNQKNDTETLHNIYPVMLFCLYQYWPLLAHSWLKPFYNFNFQFSKAHQLFFSILSPYSDSDHLVNTV